MKTVFSFIVATAAFFITTTSANAQGYYNRPVNNNNNYYNNDHGRGGNDQCNVTYDNRRDAVDYDHYRIAKDKDKIRRDLFTGNVFALGHDHHDLEQARRDAYVRDNRDRYNNRW